MHDEQVHQSLSQCNGFVFRELKLFAHPCHRFRTDKACTIADTVKLAVADGHGAIAQAARHRAQVDRVESWRVGAHAVEKMAVLKRLLVRHMINVTQLQQGLTDVQRFGAGTRRVALCQPVHGGAPDKEHSA